MRLSVIAEEMTQIRLQTLRGLKIPVLGLLKSNRTGDIILWRKVDAVATTSKKQANKNSAAAMKETAFWPPREFLDEQEELDPVGRTGKTCSRNQVVRTICVLVGGVNWTDLRTVPHLYPLFHLPITRSLDQSPSPDHLSSVCSDYL